MISQQFVIYSYQKTNIDLFKQETISPVALTIRIILTKNIKKVKT